MNLAVLDQVVKMCREGDKPLRDIQNGLCTIAEYLKVGTLQYSKITKKSEDDKDEDEGREKIKMIDDFLSKKLKLIDS